MPTKEPAFENLSLQLSRLPGVSRRNAERMALAILFSKDDFANKLAQAIVNAKGELSTCQECGNLARKGTKCHICNDVRRNRSVICVVETIPDLWAIEESGYFNGLYHVLHGHISPLEGIGPDDLNLKTLFERIKNNDIQEIILATEPTVEGDATAHYIASQLTETNIKITRIATGLPKGGSIEFADSQTIENALKSRQPLD